MMEKQKNKAKIAKYLWSRYKIIPKIPLKVSYGIRKNRLAPVFHEIFNEKKFIYIHIPKAGGSSVGTSLCGTDIIGHYPYYIHENIDSEKFASYYKFCFVRHPVDRFVSAYYYLKYSGKGRSDFRLRKYLGSGINEFIQSGSLKKYCMRIVHFVPQTHFICQGYELKVDEVFKLEDYAKSVEVLMEKLDVEIPDVHLNAAVDDVNKREGLDSISLSVLRDVYSEDFGILGYD